MSSEITNDSNCNRTIIIQKKVNANLNTEFLYNQYNWVDAKIHAEKIFWNYSFELPWAEDMWNILMFNDVVISKHIISSDHLNHENGDIILWLLAMYDLYFGYKVQLAFEYEMNRVGFLENSGDIEGSSEYLEEFFQERVGSCSGLSVDNNDVNSDNLEEHNSIHIENIQDELKDIIYEEVRMRKEIIIKRLYDYFDNQDHMIVYFMQGSHWYDNYLNINGWIDKEVDIVTDKFEKISAFISEGYLVRYIDGKKDYLIEDINDVDYVTELELEGFKRLYRESVYDFDTQLIYDWVAGGMD